MEYQMRSSWLRMLLLWTCVVLVSCTATNTKIENKPDTYSDCYLEAMRSVTPKLEATSVNICRAPYALLDPKFPYKEFKAGVAGVNSYSIAVLWNTFGNYFDFIKRELADPKVSGLELVLINETCYTRGDCGPYETLAGFRPGSLGSAINSDNPTLKARVVSEAHRAASLILPLLRPEQTFDINLLLETHQNAATVRHLWSWIEPIFSGRAQLVWNPVGGKAIAPAGFASAEAHGTEADLRDPCIANTDGAVLAQGDVSAWLVSYGTKCKKACLWTLNDNCAASNQPRMDPRRRPCVVTGEFLTQRPGMITAQAWTPAPPWSTADDLSLVNCHVNPNPDGDKKGFLAKPSEVAVYGWTVLLPAQFDQQRRPVNYTNVHAEKAGRSVGTWKYYAFYTPDNSQRPIWRAAQKAEQFPPNVVIRAFDKDHRWQCWKVHDPRQRND